MIQIPKYTRAMFSFRPSTHNSFEYRKALKVWQKLSIFAIVNRPRNGYKSVGNIKLVSIDSFKQLEVANKFDYVTNWAAWVRDKRGSFVRIFR